MTASDALAVFFPYCIKRQTDGCYAVLNRLYKPVGFWTTEHVAYENFPILVKFKRSLTSAQAAELSVNGSPNTDAIFLYDDSAIPTSSLAAMKAYVRRLGRLARYRIVRVEPRGRPASFKARVLASVRGSLPLASDKGEQQ